MPCYTSPSSQATTSSIGGSAMTAMNSTKAESDFMVAMDHTCRKALFQIMGVFAEFERSIIQERVRAGLKRAKSEGKRLGRPPIATALKERILAALNKPGRTEGVRKIAARFGVNPGTVRAISRPFEGNAVAGM
jgi:DNA invertase Pin-like site-specific DNA recombinase